MNAVSYLLLFVTSLLTAVVVSALVLHSVGVVSSRVVSEVNGLDEYISCVRSSPDPTVCVPPIEVNGHGVIATG